MTSFVQKNTGWRRSSVTLGTLRSVDATATRTSKATIDLVGKTTNLQVHLTFLYIFLTFMHDYNVKLHNFAFSGGRKQATKKFFFSLLYDLLGYFHIENTENRQWFFERHVYNAKSVSVCVGYFGLEIYLNSRIRRSWIQYSTANFIWW